MREGAGGGRGAVMEAASGRPDLPVAGGSGPGEAVTRPEGGTEGGGRQQRGWSGGAAPAKEGEGGERRGGGTGKQGTQVGVFQMAERGLRFHAPLRASLHRERALALNPPSPAGLSASADRRRSQTRKQRAIIDLGSPLLSAHLS